MTATLTRAGLRSQAAATLTTATAETATARRVRTLLHELADVELDREMANRFNPETTGAWLTELAVEERDIWDHLAEALTGH